MKQTLWRIIPPKFRGRAAVVIATILLRALLNFVGIAMFIPILILILDSGSISSNPLLGKIYNRLDFNDYDSFVLAICGAIVALIIIKNIVVLLLYRYERNFIYSLYKELSEQLYADYHSRGLGFIKGSNSAILSRNINVVCLTFVTGILRPIASIISEATLLLFFFIALLIYSPSAALLISIIFIPAATLFYLLVRRRLNNIGKLENEMQRAKSRIVIESFRGYEDIHVNGAYQLYFNKFTSSLNEAVKFRKRNATIAMLPQILMEIVLAIGLAVLVIASTNSDGDQMKLLFGILAVAAVRLIPSIRNIMTNWSSIRYNSYTIDTLSDIHSSNHPTPSNDDNGERFHLHDSIEIADLTFSFEDSSTPIIKKLSLKIDKGERVGIRGASGIGKSTLFNLILGLYRPTSGTISIDGERLTDDNIRRWQRSVGYVSQHVFIADMTLAENIALGIATEDIDRERVAEAIRLADLDDFVAQLPMGIDSHIGEQGSRLSGGQRQRIGIARALYKGCDILLLDEATSSLDNLSEENINNSLRRLSRENSSLTIVVIAHRDSSIEYCDRVITIE
ncbi:MAG: ABC transporter ATP-binding protein [Alistipes sp.]|nr:ABC transporter ATP-binding protein [Alistipes sp.]